MTKRYIRITAVAVAVFLLLAGCQFSEKQEVKVTMEDSDAIKIGITFDTFVLDRWTTDRDVFVATAEKLGAKVNVQSANGDTEKQKKQILKFAEDGMDTIVVVAVDCYVLSDVVTEVRNKGIKVVSYDRLIQGAYSDLYVTVDSGKVGIEMAKEIKMKLPEGGNIVMICGPEMDTNSLDVAAGFERELGDGAWKVIVKTHVKSWTPEFGFQAVNEAFEDAKDEAIDAVMCGNDGLAGYAIKALSELQLAGNVIVVGQDADLEACQRIVEGTQTMSVYKPIKELAKNAAESAVSLAKGEKLNHVTQTKKNNVGEVPYYGLDPIAVSASNMEEIIIESGFHPKEDVYLNVRE